MLSARKPIDDLVHDVIASGVWGTCHWELTEQGDLYLMGGELTNDVPDDLDAGRVVRIRATTTVRLPTDCSGLFSATHNGFDFLERIEGQGNWDTSHVTDMSSLFAFTTSLRSIEGLAGWDTSHVTDMSLMFLASYNAVTDFTPMSDWDTGNVGSMLHMFNSCIGMTDTDAFSTWDVHNVTDMEGMFDSCSNLTSLTGMRDWDVNSGAILCAMFAGCTSLRSLDGLQHWAVTDSTPSRAMFLLCSSLQDTSAIDGWQCDHSRLFG